MGPGHYQKPFDRRKNSWIAPPMKQISMSPRLTPAGSGPANVAAAERRAAQVPGPGSYRSDAKAVVERGHKGTDFSTSNVPRDVSDAVGVRVSGRSAPAHCLPRCYYPVCWLCMWSSHAVRFALVVAGWVVGCLWRRCGQTYTNPHRSKLKGAKKFRSIAHVLRAARLYTDSLRPSSFTTAVKKTHYF